MKFPLSLTFLRYFFSAGQAKSISKAAKENFVSQSAISQAITKLEALLGKQLITHEKNRFQLTSDGVLLLEKCKQLFTQFAEIEDAFHEAEGVFKGKLSFACTHSFALSLLPRHLGRLSHMWPDIEPVLRFGHTGTVVELVKKGDVDFGIVLDNEDFSSFDCREIYKGEYRLYQAKKTPKQAIQRFILSEERKEVSLLRRHLHAAGIDMSSEMEVSSWEVIASLAEQGLGIGFLPDYIVGKRALAVYDCLLPPIPYRLLAIFSKNRALPRNARLFIDLMCEP
ncbi:putative transcriptional regulator [Candidatus Protochlamydia naegleriophila]|uniref:Putative transcriptional regulator n=1 Tax=Candidatus Protochlamydia naegleriophila TaxID=389348 RepID=A0A0U5ET51_9BACT|nr:LysR family transcriptional regulator [Candidatus Protochlamydia naegleriophila]CUI17408.1 putative transcriptional regulator [Candidatus Protochlamydia naegleriophila]